MVKFDGQPVIDILSALATSAQLNSEQIDAAIDELELIKNAINVDDDEAIDKVDEIQDYLEYLLTDKEFLLEEVKEELINIMGRLQEGTK